MTSSQLTLKGLNLGFILSLLMQTLLLFWKIKNQITQTPAISACGGQLYFHEYAEVELKLRATYRVKTFTLMDKVPNTPLLGFPFFENSGSLLDESQSAFGNDTGAAAFGLSSSPVMFLKNWKTTRKKYIKSLHFINHFSSLIKNLSF